MIDLYGLSGASPILSKPSAPGFVLAQGNIGNSREYELEVYFSSTGGRDWAQVRIFVSLQFSKHRKLLLVLSEMKNCLFCSTNVCQRIFVSFI